MLLLNVAENYSRQLQISREMTLVRIEDNSFWCFILPIKCLLHVCLISWLHQHLIQVVQQSDGNTKTKLSSAHHQQ